MGDIQLRVMMRLRYVLCALTFGFPCWAEADERLERAREGCATEISMFCAENKDTLKLPEEPGGRPYGAMQESLERGGPTPYGAGR